MLINIFYHLIVLINCNLEFLTCRIY